MCVCVLCVRICARANAVRLFVFMHHIYELYEHLKIVQSNAENNTHHLSRIDSEKAFTPEVVEKFKETDIYKQLSKFKPYQIDTTAIENLGKNEGQIPSFGFSQEQLNALIENYRAGTPILPSYD